MKRTLKKVTLLVLAAVAAVVALIVVLIPAPYSLAVIAPLLAGPFILHLLPAGAAFFGGLAVFGPNFDRVMDWTAVLLAAVGIPLVLVAYLVLYFRLRLRFYLGMAIGMPLFWGALVLRRLGSDPWAQILYVVLLVPAGILIVLSFISLLRYLAAHDFKLPRRRESNA